MQAPPHIVAGPATHRVAGPVTYGCRPRHLRLQAPPPTVAGVWAVFFAHMAFNFGAYYMTNWNPTYYVEALGLTAAQVLRGC